jgi:Zn-dependent protease
LIVMPVVGIALFASITQTGSFTSRVIAAGFGAVLLLGSVLLHEMGHAVVAFRLGADVERVAVFLLGGFSEMDLDDVSRRHERTIVLSGPAVSAVAAGVLWMVSTTGVSGAASEVLELLAIVNAGVVVFNLLPAYPLDGGRLVRIFLMGRGVDRSNAERSAVRIGLVLGGFIVLGSLVASWVGSPLSLVALPVGVMVIGLGVAARVPPAQRI